MSKHLRCSFINIVLFENGTQEFSVCYFSTMILLIRHGFSEYSIAFDLWKGSTMQKQFPVTNKIISDERQLRTTQLPSFNSSVVIISRLILIAALVDPRCNGLPFRSLSRWLTTKGRLRGICTSSRADRRTDDALNFNRINHELDVVLGATIAPR